MKFYENMSIKNKLLLIILIVTITAIAFDTITGIIREKESIEEKLVEEVSLTARLVGQYCVTALAFPDKQGATEVLEKLESMPQISDAVVYGEDKNPFAKYTLSDSLTIKKPISFKDTSYFEDDFLNVVLPISYHDFNYGWLHLRASLSQLDASTNQILFVRILIALGAILLASLLATYLQRSISMPILELARISEKVSKEGDYTVRAGKLGRDEIGVLFDSFNNMMHQINLRETERAGAIEELRSSEERLRLLVESNESIVLVHDLDGRYVYVSAPPEYGHPKDYLGKTVDEILEEDVAEYFHKRMKKVVESDKSVKEEVEVDWHGHKMWFSEYVYPLKNKKGLIEGIVTISDNITERKVAEKFLREIKERYDLAVHAGGVGVWDHNLDTGYIYIDPSIKEMLGYDDHEIENNIDAWNGLIFDEDRENVINEIDKHLERLSGGYSVEHRMKHKDGSLRWFMVNGLAISNDEGKPFRMVGTSKDITERKLAEEKIMRLNEELEFRVSERTQQLEDALKKLIVEIENRKETEKKLIRAKEEAESANKAKSEFLANMSHEIRTPMNAILGFSELMLNETNNPKQVKYLNTIVSSGNTLLALINDILDLSKIEAGKLEFFFQGIDLAKVVNEIKQMFSQRIDEKKLDFNIKMEENLPKLLLDEVRFRQILFNLVGNAIKFTDKGFVRIEVEVDSPSVSVANLFIAVEDSGIGIHSDQQKYIFEAFSQQSGQSNRNFGGTGLGLAITKRLIENLNGTIEVKSELGRGSRFELRLENIKTIRPAVSNNNLIKTEVKNIKFKASKVLVVDDIDYNRDLIRGYLEGTNITVIAARNGTEAVEMVKKGIPDVILMDIKIPDKDGYEITDILRSNKEYSKIPILAFTASVMSDSKEKIEKYFDGFIPKPLKKEVLIRKLGQIIEHSYPEKHPERIIKEECFEDSIKSFINEKNNDELTKALNLLHTTITPKHEKIGEVIILDDVEDFLTTVRETGRQQEIIPLIVYGDKLNDALLTYNNSIIRNVLDEYSKFERLIEKSLGKGV